MQPNLPGFAASGQIGLAAHPPPLCCSGVAEFRSARGVASSRARDAVPISFARPWSAENRSTSYRLRRRGFIAGLGSAAACAIAARAQQPGMPLIGFLTSRSQEEAASHLAAFIQGLKAFGYVDGQNVVIDYRWARGQYDQLPVLASELAARRPAVLVAAGGSPSAFAAAKASRTIPIVFLLGDDPVKTGLVASLNRPGGNITGVNIVSATLGGKRLELLSRLVPSAGVLGLLVNQHNADAGSQADDVGAAARSLGRRLVVDRASTEAELESSVAALVDAGVGALVVENDPFFDTRRDQLVALTGRYALPAIYHIREFPAAGGLMSYGASLLDGYYQLGIQTGRLLKGAIAAELPIMQPTRFELVINLKTAASLGLTAPPSLLAQADEIIE
jgi:putative ABC transport system substrate-binding protein